MPEKLLTLEELALHLDIPEEEIRKLVESGVIPAYSIGGSFLRFRRDQIDAIKNEITSKSVSTVPEAGKPHYHKVRHHDVPEKFTDKVADFFYFNDFYLISMLLIAALVYVIMNL